MPRPYPTGKPLAERAGAATILGENAYVLEAPQGGDEETFGCYYATVQPVAFKYFLGLSGGWVVSCSCMDTRTRRRVCKHMVELAVAIQTGLRMPWGALVMAVRVAPATQSGPLTPAQRLRALFDDYQAATARAVILTAALVDKLEAERCGGVADSYQPAQTSIPAPLPARSVVSGFDPNDWK